MAHPIPDRVPLASLHCEIAEMRGPTSAFTVAARMVDIGTLSPQQMTQLRALDHKYQQALFTMLDGAQRAPTSAEISVLDNMAARDIAEMLMRAT